MLEGEAGIGKTTLWRAALAVARERPGWLLVTRPAESEAALGFAGLTDLFELVPDEVFAGLPEPRRHALEVALLRAPAHGALNVRAVAAAVRDVLRALSAIGRVVIAIDDVQWLDASSAQALAFALRRLDDEPVALLATRRAGVDMSVDVATAMGDDREHITVDPLGEAELHRLFRLHDVKLAPPVIRRVYEISGGNPFFALELSRGVARDADATALSVPPTLSDLVRERVESLPRATRSALLAASALSAPTVSIVSAVASSPGARDPLAAAVSAGVIEIEGDRIRFSHPLLASAIYDAVRHSVAPTHSPTARRGRDRARGTSKAPGAGARAGGCRSRRGTGGGGRARARPGRDQRCRVLPRACGRRHTRIDAGTAAASSQRCRRQPRTIRKLRAGTDAPGARGRLGAVGRRPCERSPLPGAGQGSAHRTSTNGSRSRTRRDARPRETRGCLPRSNAGRCQYLVALLDFEGAERHARASLAAAEAANDPVSILAALVGLALAGFGLGRDGVEVLERAVELEPSTG